MWVLRLWELRGTAGRTQTGVPAATSRETGCVSRLVCTDAFARRGKPQCARAIIGVRNRKPGPVFSGNCTLQSAEPIISPFLPRGHNKTEATAAAECSAAAPGESLVPAADRQCVAGLTEQLQA